MDQIDLFGAMGDEMGAVEAWGQRHGFRDFIGIDEAGRGPLAGPVVVAAVMLDIERARREGWLNRLNDSKLLSEQEREELYDRVCRGARYHVVEQSEPAEIDAVNILQATLAAMKRALAGIPESERGRGTLVMVDGNQAIPGVPRQSPVIRGDGRSHNIAAASILAKVTRDRIMARYHMMWPAYGFDEHKGYGTLAHRQQLVALGPCPIHRRSFRLAGWDDATPPDEPEAADEAVLQGLDAESASGS